MPLPVITDTIRAAAEGHTSGGTHWANILHFRKTSILTNTGAIAILDPLLLALYQTPLTGGNTWKSLCTAASGLDQLRYTPLDGVSASTINTHAVVGTAGGAEYPASVSIVASLHTALRGRSHRGRAYWGPIAETHGTTAGRIAAGSVTGVRDQWAGFIASLAGTGLTLVVASYLHSTAQDVTTVTVDSRFDTQRRRLG